MSIEQHEQVLANISSLRSDINAGAQLVNQLTIMWENSELSHPDYIDLLSGVQRRLAVHENADELPELETLSIVNTAIDGLITIASAA